MPLCCCAPIASFALFIWQETEPPPGSFDDMGTTFAAGILIAVIGAAGVAFIKIKLQRRKEAASNLSSINPANYDQPG